jgi:hypothetical protein
LDKAALKLSDFGDLFLQHEGDQNLPAVIYKAIPRDSISGRVTEALVRLEGTNILYGELDKRVSSRIEFFLFSVMSDCTESWLLVPFQFNYDRLTPILS